MALHFQYLEIDDVEFDTYWQNGGYKKISDIIFAECHIFIVSNLWWDWYNGNGTIQTSWKDLFQILYYIRIILKYDLMDLLTQCTLFDQFPSKSAWKKNCQKTHIRVLVWANANPDYPKQINDALRLLCVSYKIKGKRVNKPETYRDYCDICYSN
jgi:hypothetical protein